VRVGAAIPGLTLALFLDPVGREGTLDVCLRLEPFILGDDVPRLAIDQAVSAILEEELRVSELALHHLSPATLARSSSSLSCK